LSIVCGLLMPSIVNSVHANMISDQVAEAAVVGINDELTGQAVNAFVALKEGTESSDQVKKDLILQVRKSIGPFAAPKAIFVVPDLPKTRSGKIMRRIMRKILAGEEDQLGDTSTVSVIFFVHVGCWAVLMVTRSWWGTELTATCSSRIHR
jgi:acyl-CoA synthetase (AMP-forming)/AMP-acid ligase II